MVNLHKTVKYINVMTYVDPGDCSLWTSHRPVKAVNIADLLLRSIPDCMYAV